MANSNDVRAILKALEAGEAGSFVFQGRTYTYEVPKKKRAKKGGSDG